jgi:hypothetical protein
MKQFLGLLTSTVIALSAAVAVMAAPPGAGPAFHATFDDTVSGQLAKGGSLEPSVARKLTFEAGILGKGVYVGGNGDPNYDQAPCLEYPAANLFNADEGTVMFWISPRWGELPVDGKAHPWRFFFSTAGPGQDDATKAAGLTLWAYEPWLRLDISVPGKDNRPEQRIMAHPVRAAFIDNDWWHLAVTWKKGGWIRFYLNGLPFDHGFIYHPGGPTIMQEDMILADITRFLVGGVAKGPFASDKRADAVFDELKIHTRELAETEVMGEFRRFMPVDLTVDRRFVRAGGGGVAETFALEAWPAGILNPGVTGDVVNPAPVEFDLNLRFVKADDGSVVAEQARALAITERERIELPLPALAPGRYLAQCAIAYGGGRYQRSYQVVAYAPVPPNPDTGGLALGEPIFSIDCAGEDAPVIANSPTTVKEIPAVGTYREAGPEKENRFSYEIVFPADLAQGAPVLLEITWPDDKPRSMGLYMYVESQAEVERERLGGGIQSGEEYPTLVPAMRTAKYIFFPWREKYLFEARTMVAGMPAAVARITARPIVGRLPRLAMNPPKDLPPRHFGHMDEDQTFEIPINRDQPAGGPEAAVWTLDATLDYFDFTGQDAMNYGIARYSAVFHDLPGSLYDSRALFSVAGYFPLMLDRFGDRGKKLIASVYLCDTIPEVANRPDFFDRWLADDYLLIGADGGPVRAGWSDSRKAPNFLHPAARAHFLGHIREIARRFGSHPALQGLDLWDGWKLNGYNDSIIALFERETGAKLASGDGPDRFKKRDAELRGALKDPWNEWRAKKNAELIAEMAGILREARPDLKLHVTTCAAGGNSDRPANPGAPADNARELGFDLAAFQRIPNVVVTPVRQPTYARWQRHWDGKFIETDDLQDDMASQGFFKTPDSAAYSYLRYFESFAKPLKPDIYQCYFQNADVKPHGRFFLAELARSVAASDPALLLIGAQPLGTMGRDEETREFARAFRALPAGNFQDIPGLDDPVKARMLKTAHGLYLYAVNLTWGDAEAAIVLAGASAATDLASGEAVPLPDGALAIKLKPFQLKAFLVAGDNAAVGQASASAAQAVVDFYARKRQESDALAKQFAEFGADPATFAPATAFAAAVAKGTYAEAHRLCFAKALRIMPTALNDAKGGNLKKQKEMIARGHFAINCGSDSFHLAADGTLFFPDREYSVGAYGFDGSHSAAAHAVDKLKDRTDQELFRTETYNLNAYRFTVRNGAYTVRVRNRIGYEPNAAPGLMVMNLDIEGVRAWDKKDLFEALGRDIGNSLVSEFQGIVVKDGILDVEWSTPTGGGGWCNAIEVIPE